MSSVLVSDQIASAHAVFCGPHGAVSALARQRNVYRQTVYREAQALSQAADPGQQQELQALRKRVGQLETQVEQLQQQLQQAVVLDKELLTGFEATAQAEGVSLRTSRVLLQVIFPKGIPSIPTLGRLAQEAGRLAGPLLDVFDAFSRPRAKQVAPDELFSGKKPVLTMVEQHSLCWLGGRLAESRDGQQWAQEFRQLPNAVQITRDGGQGMEKGLALVNAERAQADKTLILDQEDHFHILHRGRRGLRAVKHKACAAFKKAEQAAAALRRDRRKGKVPDGGARARAINQLWQKAEVAMDRWSAHEKAFARLRAGLRLFTPEGRLNTPERAQAEVEAALAELTGPEWSRLKTGLVGPKAFTFLKRTQEQLVALPVSPEVREAALRVEGLKRQPEVLRQEGEAGGALRGVLLACSLVLALSGQAGSQAQTLVRGVLADAWRASSLVEGLNSVLRMQQRRQKRLTQGLLDLKRLYWNQHRFVAGKRKKKTPYQILGLVLPDVPFPQLLRMTPEQLRLQLSELNPAA